MFDTLTDPGSCCCEIPFVAQFGEDRALAEHFAGRRSGYFVEVGAYDGMEYSNTLYFERLGWNGLLIEADPELAARCRVSRPGSVVLCCAAASPEAPKELVFEIVDGHRGLSSLSVDRGFACRLTGLSPDEMTIRKIAVPAKTLDVMLAESKVEHIDFITIDVEGHEQDVLRGFSLARWKPEIVILESNSVLPKWSIMRIMHRAGYKYVRTTGCNNWFIPAEPGLLKKLHYLLSLGRKIYAPYCAGRLRSVARSIKRKAGL